MTFNTKLLTVAALALATYAGAAQASSLELSLVGGEDEARNEAYRKCSVARINGEEACRKAAPTSTTPISVCFADVQTAYKSCISKVNQGRY